MTTFIALLLDGLDKQRHHINEYAILLVFPGTGPGGMCEVFLGVVDVACGDAQESTKQLECVLLSWIPDRGFWAKRVVIFALDGASNLGVRGASARQVVDVSTIENDVFALIGTWLVVMTPMVGSCHVSQRQLGHALEAAGSTWLITWQPWIANGPCTMPHGNRRSCKSVCRSMCLINVVVCNSSPIVIGSSCCRQMRVTSLLFRPMSPGWHGIWI